MTSKLLFPLLLLIFIIAACSGGDQTNQQNDQAESTKTTVSTEAIQQEVGESPSYTAEELNNLGMLVDNGAPEGLAVGDKAPDFEAKDMLGNPIVLSKILAHKPVVLLFYRGYWCPICTRYLKAFQDSIELIQETGAIVLAVTPETADYANETLTETGTSVTLIPDSSNVIMDAYKVSFPVTEAYQNKIKEKLEADIAETNGADAAYLPVPATYIINENGEISWRHFDPNYRKRASVKDILARL